QCGIDLAELEPDVATADDEEPLGDLGHLERRRRVHDAIAHEVEAGHARPQRSRGDDGVPEADHLRLLAADPDAPRVLEGATPSHDLDLPGLGDRGETARELAHHALGLPLAQGIERDARLAEVEAELLRALGLADDRRHVQERLGGDAALVEAGAAEPLACIHHHRLEPQLRAAERRGGRLLVTIFTDRERRYRIISSRPATTRETRDYEKGI